MPNKIELLAPAGSMEALKMAVFAGADAVYLSGKNFGARAFAKNFENEELKEAVEFAHIRGVKVYLTLNTIIFESEIDDLRKYLDYISKINIDACIVQDLGIVKLIRENYPSLIVHASTQMNIYSQEGINQLIKLGVKRVVLARETPIDVIKNLKNIEIEVFCHGALCFAYSGNCLMSYIIGKRSGNRGSCAQPCRRKYSLSIMGEKVCNESSILSMKDLMTIENIPELIESNVSSLKIEGRMKSPEYVYTIVKHYRNAIDKYYSKQKFILNNQNLNEIKVVFNREFTKGYIFKEKNSLIVNKKSVNHQGIEIGKIEKITNKDIYIKLNDVLNYKDGIRFKNTEIGFNINQMYISNNLTKKANSGDLVRIPFVNSKIKIGMVVLKTVDASLSQLTEQIINKFPNSISVNMNLTMKLNQPLRLELIDQDQNKIIATSRVLNYFENSNLTKVRVIEQLSKLGTTAYLLKDINIEFDQFTDIKISEINELRRNAIELLNQKRIENNINEELQTFDINNDFIKDEVSIEVVVSNDEQYKEVKKIDNIKVYYKEYLNRGISKNNIKTFNAMIHNLNHFENIDNTLSIYGNIANTEAIKMAKYLGVHNLYLSTEVNINNLELMNLKELPLNIGIMAYGKRDMMITNHCIIANNLNYTDKNCKFCHANNDFLIEDEYHNQMCILTNEDCQNRILEPIPINYLNDIKKYLDLGINKILIVFTTETKEQVKKIINQYKKVMV